MKNKKIFIALVLVILIGLIVYLISQSKEKVETNNSTTKDSSSQLPSNSSQNTQTDKTMTDSSMANHGNYVELADFEKDPNKYQGTKNIYFFHASWCPICQGIEKEINADMTRIPGGVTLIKTDFDKNTDLRKKYGVTTQYTFVQVDKDGNEVAQWTASNLEKAVNNIEM